MANNWKVKFIDDEMDDEQIASFTSKEDASLWIKNQKMQERYDPTGFEVVDGPYEDKGMISEDSDAIQKVNEETSSKFNPEQYVKDFKDHFGYKDGYMPNISYNEAMDRLARECALMMPTDTAAREIEGDAVILLVLSGEDEAVEAGKNLGDCMMKNAKHDEQTLLKHMSDAYKALQKLWSKHERKDELNESADIVKIWIDDVRPAPKGYLWLKSTNDFINFIDKNGISNVQVIDLDHDAGDYAKDGGDYIRCLDYLEFIGADGLNVRLHSANPVGIKNMKAVIKKNQWNEVPDIIDEDEAALESFDGGDYDALALDEVDEAEDAAAKDKIVSALKKASKDFQKSASNYDPEQFSKIIVAFDDLASGVGAYDFKQKKVLKEVDRGDIASSNVDVSQDMLDKIAQKMKDAGAVISNVEFIPFRHAAVIDIYPEISMHGNFDDRLPLESLHFHWHDKDENADAGWYEGTKCKNKWRGVGKKILDEILPDGIPNNGNMKDDNNGI